MFQTERLSIIKDYLIKNHTATIRDLSELLNVSSVTMRKDLAVLEEERFLTKTHGGAVFNKPNSFHEMDVLSDNYQGLDCIANLAAQEVKPGDSIFLGSGGTCLLLAQKIKHIENISVVTHNVSAIPELIPYVKNIMLIGGEITYHNNMIYASSERVERYLEGIYISKAFTSAVGVDASAGLTVNNMSSSYIYRSIPSICHTWYVMCDSHKINKIGLFQVASLDHVDYLITDSISPQNAQAFSEKNISIIQP